MNVLYNDVKTETSLLTQRYPNRQFSIYDYEYKSSGYSLPLSAYLSFLGLILKSGIPIGIKVASSSSSLISDAIIGTLSGYELLEIHPKKESFSSTKPWLRVHPSDVYRSTEEWYISVK